MPVSPFTPVGISNEIAPSLFLLLDRLLMNSDTALFKVVLIDLMLLQLMKLN